MFRRRLLAERGAVDADVALALALALALAHGARDRIGATYGMGLTGVAGPDFQDGKAAGIVFPPAPGQPTASSSGTASTAGGTTSGATRWQPQ